MPPINGNTFTVSRNELKAQCPSGHPPVVISGLFAANTGILPVGLILKRFTDGITLVPFVEGDPSPIGVLDETVDTSQQTSGNYVAHGSVQNGVLGVGLASVVPSQASLINLQAHGIFPQ